MDKDTIIKSAHGRAVSEGLPYAGSLTPPEADRLRQADPQAAIVDVRTKAELNYVGRIPDAIEIEWLDWPDGRVNEGFLAELKAAGVGEDRPVMFICRSGVRSHNAALAAQASGYHQVFNVIEGFEGDPDENGQRGKTSGWRFHGLPWHQS
ncbi:MAG: rhodanese-like domain-containing protein [Betaproteobacteria bacterium AqS2]|uniref:Rhodanese-like domain-containing protein n=1 Tax=Candidatus Amphirhobacter heronislandensis TaxID=1732024 RepID=A0A930UGK9_9GAMM|nr:rhodanese-like domain-containing protein [Betaproteobacteria bacterium AqS2]